MRPDALPYSGVVRKAVPVPLPGVAPAGINVPKTATPDALVVAWPVIGGTPRMFSVNVMSRPARLLPPGSVATALSFSMLGSCFALILEAEAVRVTLSLPVPRWTVRTAVAALPAGSVAVTEIAFAPSASGRTTWKLPVPSAVPIAVRPFAALRALTVDAPCVLPAIGTADGTGSFQVVLPLAD